MPRAATIQVHSKSLAFRNTSISSMVEESFIESAIKHTFAISSSLKESEDVNVRDRGSNMKKVEEVLSFYMPNSLSGICIDCCILVSIFSYVHHASSCRGKKIVSKVRNFFNA